MKQSNYRLLHLKPKLALLKLNPWLKKRRQLKKPRRKSCQKLISQLLIQKMPNRSRNFLKLRKRIKQKLVTSHNRKKNQLNN